uniref:Restriction of telomere capping protein 1 n=1 Tax=Anthurium amnicola TaxID=1678845 RepID=A0A1D1Z301_9ARAE
MENQEGSSEVENPPSVENLSIAEEEVDLNSMESVTFTESENSNIFPVYPNRNKYLKTIALNILKYLPEDILREEPDFSAVKTGDVSIPDNGLCTYCEKPILSDNHPRSVIINVCGHIHHRTCAKEIDRRGVLSCGTCHVSDDSDPLILTTQASKCAKCSVKIPAEPSEPVVLLPCQHMVHFECIDNKRKLCPGCPTIYELEKEGYYISPETPRKRRRQEGEHRSTRGTKAQTIIRELSVFTLDELSISAPSEALNMEDVSN